MSTAFVGALRYEWWRMRSLRTTWLLLGLACATNAAIAGYYAQRVRSGTRSLTDLHTLADVLCGAGFAAPASATALCAGLIGVLAGGQDHRHGTGRASLLAVPRRGVLFAARLTVLAVLAAVAALVALCGAFAVAAQRLAPVWSVSVLTRPGLARVICGFIVLSILTALLGLGLAGLLRRLLPAAALLLATPLLIEPGVTEVLRRGWPTWSSSVVEYLPFTAGHRLLDLPAGGGSEIFATPALVGGATFSALAAIGPPATAALLVRRDA
jgi:ABC-2 type transport system permease protein